VKSVTATAVPLAVTAGSDADYERLGLVRGDIKAWEDGARTDDRPGVVTFSRHRDLSRNRMIEGLHGVNRAAAELLRFDGAYLRFAGEIRVEHYVQDQIVDQSATEDAIWELMYFGHARA
jgi:hypothetical protein